MKNSKISRCDHDFSGSLRKKLLGSDQNATLSARIDSMHKRRMRVMSLAAQPKQLLSVYRSQFVAPHMWIFSTSPVFLRYSSTPILWLGWPVMSKEWSAYTVWCFLEFVPGKSWKTYFHGWTSRCSYCSCPPEEQWPSGGITTSQVSL